MIIAPLSLSATHSLDLEPLMQALREQGWCWCDDWLPRSMLDELVGRINSVPENSLTEAGIGRADQHHIDTRIRRDKTRWLTGEHPAEAHFLAAAGHLMHSLNEQLLLGLFNFEAHFARYEPGDYYRKHLDALQGQRNRILSSVLYLNPDWQPGDGGELLLFDPDQDDSMLACIPPRLGHAVFFLSEQFPHEVVPSRTDRHSIAGWFRVRTCNPLHFPLELPGPDFP